MRYASGFIRASAPASISRSVSTVRGHVKAHEVALREQVRKIPMPHSLLFFDLRRKPPAAPVEDLHPERARPASRLGRESPRSRRGPGSVRGARRSRRAASTGTGGAAPSVRIGSTPSSRYSPPAVASCARTTFFESPSMRSRVCSATAMQPAWGNEGDRNTAGTRRIEIDAVPPAGRKLDQPERFHRRRP